MGIPGLNKLVEEFMYSSFLGCIGAECHTRSQRQVVIDGPSLTHLVYNRSRTGFEHTPYGQLGREVVAFLDRLEKCGVAVTAVYFDGFLPPEKRGERAIRISKVRNALRGFHARNPDGVNISEGQKYPHKMPAAPFIVPAAIDALMASVYANRTYVVPGESDGYCAAHVRQHGGYVLTSDSDLVVYDLGRDGAVARLDGIRTSHCARCREPCVRANKMLRPSEIADRLGLPHFQRLAYEAKKDPKVTVDDALRRMQQPMENISVEAYGRFRDTYSSFQNLTYLIRSSWVRDWLDPRVSEFVIQVETTAEEPFCSYLLPLLDDPSKSSAWECCLDMRIFSYSVKVREHVNQRSQIRVLEYDRREENATPVEIKLMDGEACDAFADAMNKRIQAISLLHRVGPAATLLCWRTLAMEQTLPPYNQERRNFTPRQAPEQAADRAKDDSVRSWDNIHVHAQLQAVLYSLRQMREILGKLQRPSPPVWALTGHLRSLPSLETLIPACNEMLAFFVHVEQFPLKDPVSTPARPDLMLEASHSRPASGVKVGVAPVASMKRRHESDGEGQAIKRLEPVQPNVTMRGRDLLHASGEVSGIFGEHV